MTSEREKAVHLNLLSTRYETFTSWVSITWPRNAPALVYPVKKMADYARAGDLHEALTQGARDRVALPEAVTTALIAVAQQLAEQIEESVNMSGITRSYQMAQGPNVVKIRAKIAVDKLAALNLRYKIADEELPPDE
jgi:hypothetical protein